MGEGFELGRAYTRQEIHDALGGSIQAFLPTLGGKVLAVCIDLAMNPKAPDRILVGTKPQVAATADILAQQPGEVPVFVKRRSSEWVYRGDFRVAEVCRDPEQLVEAARAAGRDNLHMWIDLVPAE